MIKRIFDLLFSIIALILFSPFLIIIAIVIKLHDFGPVFYMAPRVGQHGKLFNMFKFRTMVLNADKIGASSTTLSDSRITTIGHFLRKYKLDELPQLRAVERDDLFDRGVQRPIRGGQRVVGVQRRRWRLRRWWWRRVVNRIRQGAVSQSSTSASQRALSGSGARLAVMLMRANSANLWSS